MEQMEKKSAEDSSGYQRLYAGQCLQLKKKRSRCGTSLYRACKNSGKNRQAGYRYHRGCQYGGGKVYIFRLF